MLKKFIAFFEEGIGNSRFSAVYFCAVLFLPTKSNQKGVSERQIIFKNAWNIAVWF